MSIKIYRQNALSGTASPPTTLNYGEIACDKDGKIYSSNEEDVIVEQMNTTKYAYVGNPNLGTNTNFLNVVNQRKGETYMASTGNSIYAIDRWRISGATYTVNTHTLTAPSYAARSCGMWQSNEMGAHQLSIGDDVTVSIYANGKLHTPTMKVIDRDLYDAFANVPASYDCDDFEIVLCTYARDKTKYNLGIYPKKSLTVNYIKWEKGSAATPYVPKNYSLEFAECQRYFYYLDSTKWYQCDCILGWGVVFTVHLAVPMRVIPTLNTVGTAKVFTSDGWTNVTSIKGTNNFIDKSVVSFLITISDEVYNNNIGNALMITGVDSLTADL